MGGITETERGFDAIFVQKRPRTHPFTVVRTMYNGPAAFIAQEHELTGPTLCYKHNVFVLICRDRRSYAPD